MDHAEFKAVEDAAVRSAVELEEGSGIDVVTDGEFRRYAFYGRLRRVRGIRSRGRLGDSFPDEHVEQLILNRPVVVNLLRWKRSM